jgi:gliding motility-associated-like protein
MKKLHKIKVVVETRSNFRVDQAHKNIMRSFFSIPQSRIAKAIRTLIMVVTLLSCNINLSAQNVGACNNTRNICPGAPFTFTNTTNNKGLTPGLGVSNPPLSPQGVPYGGCMFGDAVNPEWIIINIASSGNLGFILGAAGSPNPQSSFLHWNLYRYTPTTCTNIFNNTLAPLACNFNGFPTGGTGMGPLPAFGFTVNYQPSIPVLQGEQYLLLVSNTSSLVTTVTFSNNGTAGLTCNPLSFSAPSLSACPNQNRFTSAVWPGMSNTSYTVLPPASYGQPVPPPQTSPNFTVSGPNTGAGIFTVIATGTNSIGQTVTANRNFTLNVNATSSLSVAHATNYCYGSCGIFTLTPGSGTFSASGPGFPPTPGVVTTGGSSTISVCPLVSPQNNGVFQITGTFTTGCTGSATTQVNIAPDNFITITNAFDPDNTLDICQGGCNTIFANMPTATSYSLTGPGLAAPIVTAAVLGQGNFQLCNIQPTNTGVYTVSGFINYNGITCIRQATLLVRLVQTYSITAQTSYTFCEGTPACLTASAVGTNSNSFTWNGPLGFASTAQNPCITQSITTAPNPNMAGFYGVTASFDNGFRTCTRSANIQVQVVSVPQVFIAMPTPICQNQVLSMCITPSGAFSYSWAGPAGFTSTMQCENIVNIQPTAAGTYTARVVYAIGTRTCAGFSTKNLNVIAVPDVSISPAQVVCRPDDVRLAADALGGLSYNWVGPGTFTDTGNQIRIYNPPVTASGIYTVYVNFSTNGFGCTNTNTVSVSINPVMSFTLPSFLRACPDEILTVAGPVGATSYTWLGSPGYTSNNRDLVLSNISPTLAGTYILSVNLGPCVSKREVEIEILSKVTFTLPPRDREICRGDSTLFQVGASGGTEVYAFDWFPANYLDSPTGSVVIGNVLGTTVFNVTVRDVGCPNNTDSHVFTVLVNQPPIPDLRLENTEGCDPLRFQFNTHTNNIKNGGITTFDFIGVQKIQGDDFAYTFPSAGTYSLRITTVAKINNLTCKADYDYPNPFVVYPRAAPSIQWTPDLPNTTDNVVTFNASSKNAMISYYNWMFAGTNSRLVQDTSDLKNPQRVYEETGKYPVLLIATTDYGCIDTTITFLEINDDLNVFIPNSFTPNSDGINDVFQVKGIGFKAENFLLEVFDRWGRSVYASKDVTKGWDGTVKGQTPSEGLYIYRVRIIGANGEGRKEYMGNVTLIR